MVRLAAVRRLAYAANKRDAVETLYNGDVSAHTISNPVPSPEEMGEILGLSPERVNAVRRIMSTPSAPKAPRAGRKVLRKSIPKKFAKNCR